MTGQWKCPKMKNCILNSDEDEVADRKYGCYSWDGDFEDLNDLKFSVKICEYDDEICDIHAISDKSEYTI